MADSKISLRTRLARLTAVAGAAAVLMAGCATQNETTGTIAGVIIGAALGKAIAGDRGAVIGAALGGAIGHDIGKRLDARDKERLAEAQQRALAQSTPQRFYADSARGTIFVTPGPTIYEPSPRQLALAADLQRVELVEQAFDATSAETNVPVYRAPNFSTLPKLTVPKGAPIARVAYVRADPMWVVVGDRSFGIGYVPAIYFDPDVARKLATASNTRATAPPLAAAPGAPIGTSRTVNRAATRTPQRSQAPASAPSRTDDLLAASNSYVPPSEHLRQRPVGAREYQQVVDGGNRAARQNSRDVTMVKPVVECKELTSVLLTDNKETGREVTKACKGSSSAPQV